MPRGPVRREILPETISSRGCDMSSDLFLAVLAMDAYNRGYNNGVVMSGTQIGSAVIVDYDRSIYCPCEDVMPQCL